MAEGIKSFIGDFGAAIMGEFFAIGVLQKILTKGVAQKVMAGKTVAGQDEEGKDMKIPDIKLGGIFDLSDETAYFGLIARIKMENDPCLKDGVIKLSKFVNGSSFQTHGQRRRFRVVVGSLANIEYSRGDIVEEIPVSTSGGKPTTKKVTTPQTKTNLGLEFLKSFCQLTEPEMLEVCKASGIMESVIDNISKGLKQASTKIAEVREKIEKNPTAKKIMTSAAEKMRARITELKAKQQQQQTTTTT